MQLIVVSIGAIVAVVLFLLWKLQSKIESLQKLLSEAKVKEATLIAQATAKEESYQEKTELLATTEKRFKDVLQAMAQENLEKSNRSFLQLAQENFKNLHTQSQGGLEKLVHPVKETLAKLDEGIRKIDKERKGEHELVKEQIRAMTEAEKSLRKETANLVSALRKPDVRGMWGEIQLKRVVEMAGMLNYCDFCEQQVIVEDQNRLRPDLIVRLPGERSVVVDAKAPFEAFLEANNTSDDGVRLQKLQTHAKHLRGHIQQLGRKSYWRHFQPSPEFVVLFLPAEIFFSSALQFDPSLIELGAKEGVIIATPMTLIGLLRAVAYGWKQDQFSKNALEISQLGQELHKRVYDMTKHMGKMGKHLAQAINSYNDTVGSLERRVLVSTRKFKEFGAAADSLVIETPETIDQLPRAPIIVD